jgi:hypothetical protein
MSVFYFEEVLIKGEIGSLTVYPLAPNFTKDSSFGQVGGSHLPQIHKG